MKKPSKKELELYYEAARNNLINIFGGYGAGDLGLVNYPERQVQLVVDALALFICAVDGNAFYTLEGASGKTHKHHEQYFDYALEILEKGLIGFKKDHDCFPGQSPDYMNKIFSTIKAIKKEDKAQKAKDRKNQAALIKKIIAQEEKKKNAKRNPTKNNKS